MPFDTQTRNRLARLVTDVRELITSEFAQQLQGVYGIASSGEVTPLAELNHLDEEQRVLAELLRDRVEYLKASSAEEKDPSVAAVDRLTREQAFTILNRLAALRMAENREFILESVGRGYQSKGFQVYSQVAGSGLGDTYHRYRRYLFCLFDEIAVDLGALFDRRTSAGLLFPRETALLALFQLINAPEVEPFWAEDETIGWIYQYYNDEAERKRMREKSAAPRNSRELAVRNQFFTPRYVVEFLVDNTLGRVWCEAQKGKTALKELCRYMVRRPSELFLSKGESAPASNSEHLGNEEALKQPLYVPHRPRKDPRDLKILDPACGSGHFLLYSFDLLETIYEESWVDEVQSLSQATGRSIRDDYPDLRELQKVVPELIILHNLHGIDIDLRACQIAALALWLRAQRTYQRQNLKPEERPKITRSNVVCAEPMPGERLLLESFVAELQPRVLGQLVQVVFEKMKLAGEAGALLKIEDEVAGAVADAKRLWLETPKAEQSRLFVEDRHPEQGSLGLDLSGITDEAFWGKAEEQIYAALQAYAEQAENGHGFQRRLFASDAARGFAFIDLCRKCYDIILMNPPFGEASVESRKYLYKSIPIATQDLFAAFVERANEMLNARGTLGTITNRLALFKDTLREWRKEFFLGEESALQVVADLGYGVLDGAVVEAAAYVTSKELHQDSCVFVSVLDTPAKGSRLLDCVNQTIAGIANSRVAQHRLDSFLVLPRNSIPYWCSGHWFERFRNCPKASDQGVIARKGLETGDDFRFLRLLWEVAPNQIIPFQRWTRYSKGGAYRPFYSDLHLAFDWSLRASARRVSNSDLYGRAGITYTERTTSNFAPRVLPAGSICSPKGPGIYDQENDRPWGLLAFLSSSVVIFYLEMLVGGGDSSAAGTAARDFSPSFIEQLPVPNEFRGLLRELEEPAKLLYSKLRLFRIEEPSDAYAGYGPVGLTLADSSAIRLKGYENAVLEVVKIFEAIDSAVNSAYHLSTRELADLASYLGRPLPSKDSVDAKAEQLIRELVTKTAETPREEDSVLLQSRALTKLSYVADPTIESISHKAGISPAAVVSVRRKHNLLPADELRREADDAVSFAVGCIFSRWNVARKDDQENPVLENIDPFCDNDAVARNGSNASTASIPPAILLDDANSIDNSSTGLGSKVRDVLLQLWPKTSDSVEEEICRILNVRSLHEYFRDPTRFFDDHLRRYSRSRRQAPIYWPLSTRSCRYTLWLYYPRLTTQTLHGCIADFLVPKLKSISAEIQMLRNSNGSLSRLNELLELQDEVNDIQMEIETIIRLPYSPNLDDGVLVTASPLRKLFRLARWRTDLETCWEELQAGDHDWAHLALSVWPDRVRQKCKTDRSIAIAHNLEHLCEVEQRKRKAQKSRVKQGSLINEGAH